MTSVVFSVIVGGNASYLEFHRVDQTASNRITVLYALFLRSIVGLFARKPLFLAFGFAAMPHVCNRRLYSAVAVRLDSVIHSIDADRCPILQSSCQALIKVTASTYFWLPSGFRPVA